MFVRFVEFEIIEVVGREPNQNKITRETPTVKIIRRRMTIQRFIDAHVSRNVDK
jgi:hypothetical protein